MNFTSFMWFYVLKNNMIEDTFAKFDGAFSKKAIGAHRSDFAKYQNWCLQNSLDPIPVTAETMAMYVDYLSENNKSATIRRRINSLSTVLKLSKNHDPTKAPEVVLALKRMHRKFRSIARIGHAIV